MKWKQLLETTQGFHDGMRAVVFLDHASSNETAIHESIHDMILSATPDGAMLSICSLFASSEDIDSTLRSNYVSQRNIMFEQQCDAHEICATYIAIQHLHPIDRIEAYNQLPDEYRNWYDAISSPLAAVEGLSEYSINIANAILWVAFSSDTIKSIARTKPTQFLYPDKATPTHRIRAIIDLLNSDSLHADSLYNICTNRPTATKSTHDSLVEYICKHTNLRCLPTNTAHIYIKEICNNHDWLTVDFVSDNMDFNSELANSHDNSPTYQAALRSSINTFLISRSFRASHSQIHNPHARSFNDLDLCNSLYDLLQAAGEYPFPLEIQIAQLAPDSSEHAPFILFCRPIGSSESPTPIASIQFQHLPTVFLMLSKLPKPDIPHWTITNILVNGKTKVFNSGMRTIFDQLKLASRESPYYQADPTIAVYFSDWFLTLDSAITEGPVPKVIAHYDNAAHSPTNINSSNGLAVRFFIHRDVVYFKIYTHWSNLEMAPVDAILLESRLVLPLDRTDSNQTYFNSFSDLTNNALKVRHNL